MSGIYRPAPGSARLGTLLCESANDLVDYIEIIASSSEERVKPTAPLPRVEFGQRPEVPRRDPLNRPSGVHSFLEKGLIDRHRRGRPVDSALPKLSLDASARQTARHGPKAGELTGERCVVEQAGHLEPNDRKVDGLRRFALLHHQSLQFTRGPTTRGAPPD